ncbi:Hypothetical_protein [Hexamita inflata]|uniref:Hypothetical_protein n=1 Tax=Hexamita inflata TaxID=28002 RepID=A0AA86N4T5_9EUKA|nr:Hypothetical protein HINF_LOCUS396 [Hexamita inflata]
MISLNKNILYTNKKQLQDNYQDLQISRSLNDISRSRSQMQLVVSSVLPNVEIRHNFIQPMSQPQQVMRQLRKQNSKLRLQPTKSLATLSPLVTQSFSNQVCEADFKTIEDHPNFKELVLNKYRKESSGYVHISVRKMDTIDTGTTALRTSQTKYQSFKARYNLTKLQIDSLLQQQVRKQESFFNNIAQLFNILCEAFQ